MPFSGNNYSHHILQPFEYLPPELYSSLSFQYLVTSTLLSVSLILTTLGTSYKWNYTIFVFLYPAYFRIHPCCNIYQIYILFHGLIIFPPHAHTYAHTYTHTHTYIYICVCAYTLYFVYSLSIDRHLGYFCLLANVSSTAMNIDVQVSV